MTRLVRAGGKNVAGRRGLRARSRTTWPSSGWTGTRRPPTRTWASGAPCASSTAGRVAVRHPHVITQLDAALARRGAADRAPPRSANTTDAPVSGVVRGAIEAVQFAEARDARAARARDRALHPGRVPAARRDEPARLVAVPHGAAGAVHARSWTPTSRAASLRPAGGALRDPQMTLRADREGSPALQGQRQADPDPRRRLGLRTCCSARPRASGWRPRCATSSTWI